MAHAKGMDYVTVLGSVARFAPALWRLAFAHDIPLADEKSAIKQLKQRVAGPGMHWSRSAAEEMLPLASSITSRSFDALWDAA